MKSFLRSLKAAGESHSVWVYQSINFRSTSKPKTTKPKFTFRRVRDEGTCLLDGDFDARCS
ncbi:MAG: hypothetical protein ACKVHP_03030 [Verrucomicrobiales bacterium]